MRVDQNPIHRRAIVPWYDSETVCIGVIIFAAAVFLFGICGIFVAVDAAQYRDSCWIAVLLAVLSGGLIASTSIRLVIRYSKRYKE